VENCSAVAGTTDQAQTVIAVITVVTAFVVLAGDWRQVEPEFRPDMQDESMGRWYRPNVGMCMRFSGAASV
jgi:hypothetical protein